MAGMKMCSLTWACVVLFLCAAVLSLSKGEEVERHPNDGWFNNLIHPDWGAIDTHLLRRSPTSYSDGVYQPSGMNRPNPLDISRIAFSGDNDLASVRRRNALLVFYGQQLVEEILDAQRPGCPIEYFNIKVPKGHPYNPNNLDDLEMPFQRTRYDQSTGYSPNNPRQQINEITPFLDGTLVYGVGKAWEDNLREFKDGRLKQSDPNADLKDSFPVKNDVNLPFANPPSPRDHFLRPVNRFSRFGNPRTHENPFINSFAVYWFRYHNYIAGQLKAHDSSLDDEQIFNAARKRVIAQYQKTTMYEWLPPWLMISNTSEFFDMSQYPYKGGAKNPYQGYDPNVHPGISTEFQAAAMRFGHTVVPSGVVTKKLNAGVCEDTRRMVKSKFTNVSGDGETPVRGVRLCNAFWVPDETVEAGPGIDEITLGFVYTLSAMEDNIIVADLREFVFGSLDWSRRDLGALNIQRGRDHGLPGYNAIRKAYGLEPKTSWRAINPNIPHILDQLQMLYGNTTAPDELDLFPGGFLETTFDGPGDLFRAILLDQFLRIRHGDRFWYENEDNGLFTDDERREINETTFFDILKSVTRALDDVVIEDNGTIFRCPEYTGSGCQCTNPAFTNVPSEAASEKCVPLQHYDYFSGSEVSFIITVVIIILSLPLTIGVMLGLSRARRNTLNKSATTARATLKAEPNQFYAVEWVGRTTYGLLNSRDVKITLEDHRQKILVANLRKNVVRMIDLRRRVHQTEKPRASVTRSNDKGNKLMMINVPGEIDLVMHFTSSEQRNNAFTMLQSFLHKHNWDFHEGNSMSENVMWREATTIDERKEVLARFFKSVLAEMKAEENDEARQDTVEEVLTTQLTRTEFADALGLQPHSLFVRNMFLLADSSGDGFVSFDEFKSCFGLLIKGKSDQKAEMFFRMFDTSRSGKLTKENYKKMIESLVELNDAGGKNMNINNMVDTVFKELGREQQGYLTLEDFKKAMFSDTADVWNNAALTIDVGGETAKIGGRQSNVKDRAKSFVAGYKNRTGSRPTSLNPAVNLPSKKEEQPKTKFEIYKKKVTRYVDNHRRQIFWLSLYTFVTIAIFVERAYYYSVEREHAGLRRMAGYGVSVTRGAASAQMFTYASLLVTMSRNTLTFFRETFLHRFIPFDNAHDMHIIVAGMAMFFTFMHVIGHLLNFYHISTQPSSPDLACYFREYFRPTHVLASFHYWTWQTITGLTGVALVLALFILYVFATPYARRNAFSYFKTTHNLYIIIYILMFLHGHQRLVQPPLWPWFFIGPLIVFVLDKLVSVSRNKILLPVHKAVLLPSGVINLVFKRPLTFNYQSGQWVRIACPKLGKGEYHPFTLTSAPHEEHLSLHIRAVGPWTSNLRRLYDPNNSGGITTFPKVYVDGPFGESHQDWFRYPVSVLVGGGIGVTPFASILKDISHRTMNLGRIPCQKVYFIWVTRTQQSFEWMTDIIRAVEAADTLDFVDVHICITQIKEQFDLRTTMLYICERYFQKIAGVSMFTGLRAKTHFGRPKLPDFFAGLKDVHSTVDQIGVFSCGPPAMTNSVQSACTDQNSYTGPSLIHHFENF